MQLKPSEFAAFRDLVYRSSGITLGEGKESLVGARVGKRMRALGLEGFREYLDLLAADAGAEGEMVQMLDAISTNVTSFFREAEHFGFLAKAVAGWRAGGQSRFRFWSAACSSGEEPYSLAMTLREAGLGPDTDTRILATDISTRILDAAREGAYPAAKASGLPAGYASRYCARSRDGGLAMGDDVKSMIAFARLNLSTPPFPMRGPFDAILVRNVMIYFDNRVREALIAECHRMLRPGGYLLVGHAESLAGLAGDFKCLRPSIYAKRGT